MNQKAPKAGRPERSVAEATNRPKYRSQATRRPPPVDPLDASCGDGDDEDSLPAPGPLAAVDDVRRFEVGLAQDGSRLDRALAAWVPEHSRSHLQVLVEQGQVMLNGQTVLGPSQRLLRGQSVVVRLITPASQQPFAPEPMALDVRHADEHLLVLCKPAGLVVHPAAGNWQGTLLNGLLAHDPAFALLPRAGIVHRLDKDTSGLMVVARTPVAMTGLVRAIAAREVHRGYLAITHGVVQAEPLILDGPIGRDPRVRVRMAVVSGGREARTDVRRVATDGHNSAVACTLHTGRTHQIRVHLSHGGHPLVSDALYGGSPGLGLVRQALHAAELRFTHPIDGREVAVQAPPPDDFAGAWRQVVEAAVDWLPPAADRGNPRRRAS